MIRRTVIYTGKAHRRLKGVTGVVEQHPEATDLASPAYGALVFRPGYDPDEAVTVLEDDVTPFGRAEGPPARPLATTRGLSAPRDLG